MIWLPHPSFEKGGSGVALHGAGPVFSSSTRSTRCWIWVSCRRSDASLRSCRPSGRTSSQLPWRTKSASSRELLRNLVKVAVTPVASTVDSVIQRALHVETHNEAAQPTARASTLEGATGAVERNSPDGAAKARRYRWRITGSRSVSSLISRPPGQACRRRVDNTKSSGSCQLMAASFSIGSNPSPSRSSAWRRKASFRDVLQYSQGRGKCHAASGLFRACGSVCLA
jgi:hypothetical protein